MFGEMWGDRAVQAPAFFIACKRNSTDGVERTMLGGITLAGMCTTEGWERWRGTMIFIPTGVDLPRSRKSSNGHRLDQMMCDYLNRSTEGRDSFWKQSWKA